MSSAGRHSLRVFGHGAIDFKYGFASRPIERIELVRIEIMNFNAQLKFIVSLLVMCSFLLVSLRESSFRIVHVWHFERFILE